MHDGYPEVPCPACGDDMYQNHGTSALGWAHPAGDQDSPALDLVISCDCCGARFNAFIPLSAFTILE